jgi:hypothetical protein
VGADKAMPGRSCEYVNHCEDPDACPTGCDCSSVVTPEQDGYFCTPQPGYATYYPHQEYEWVTKPRDSPSRLDEVPHLCASQTMPDLSLLGDAHMVLTQGTKYEESGVTITDVSTVDLKRRFTTDYSSAEALAVGDFSGFAKKCGSYAITYELATPWIKGRSKATITRTVDVVDANECEYKGADGDFYHMCHFPAKCVNVACGTSGFDFAEAAYDCICEHPDYEPDGDHGCQLKAVDPEEEVPKKEAKEEEVTPGSDAAFYEKLHSAFEEIQWGAEVGKLHASGLRNYKKIISKLHAVSHEANLLPPAYEWDKPYRSLAVEDVRALCVKRGLSSVLGASASPKKDLVVKLAQADYDDFDNEYK